MNILFLSSNRGKIAGLNLTRPLHLVLMTGIVALLMAASGYLGYSMNPSQDSQEVIDAWQADVHRYRVELDNIREEADADINAMSSRIGLLQAHVMRLDALGRKLVHMASIDAGEFDFENTPALGGPETVNYEAMAEDELNLAIDQLAFDLEARENQLVVLDNYLLNENLRKEVQPSGRPIVKGWISSYYGMRTHPISGRREMHKGIDFAGKLGGPVIAVAKGVVTYAGKRWGYG